MDARPRLGRSGKRLALATCAIALVAAAFSGPALADPGLSALLSDVTEALPPAVGDPVDDVGSSLEPALEPVQAPVDAVVATVEQTTEFADATISDGLSGVEQTIDDTLGAVDETTGTVSGVGQSPQGAAPPASASPSSAAAPADTSTTRVDTIADLPTTPTGAAPSGVAPRMRDAALPAVQVRGSRAPDFVPSGALPRAPKRPAQASATHAVLTTDVPAAVGKKSPDAGGLTRSPEAPSHGDPLGLEWLVPQPPAPALLIATLLGLLALVVPRSGGRRLHPAVAPLRPADARFRLVRPG